MTTGSCPAWRAAAAAVLSAVSDDIAAISGRWSEISPVEIGLPVICSVDHSSQDSPHRERDGTMGNEDGDRDALSSVSKGCTERCRVGRWGEL